jgi:hypothetical protein
MRFTVTFVDEFEFGRFLDNIDTKMRTRISDSQDEVRNQIFEKKREEHAWYCWKMD